MLFCDQFLIMENNYFTNLAGDAILYVTDSNAAEAVSNLKVIAENLFTGLSQSEMKARLDECHSNTSQSLNPQIL